VVKAKGHYGKYDLALTSEMNAKFGLSLKDRQNR